jgi:hypothetical protein
LQNNGTQLIGLDSLRNQAVNICNSIRELYDYLISNNVPLRQGLTITGNANLTFNRAAAGSVLGLGEQMLHLTHLLFLAVSHTNFYQLQDPH